MSSDEKQNTFNQLSQLAPQFAQSGINILPILAKYAPMDMKDRDALAKLASPQPAQPDPLNQALLDSQAKLQYAQAEKLTAEARNKGAEAGIVYDKILSEIAKNYAAAAKDDVDAGKTEFDVWHTMQQPAEPRAPAQ